MGRRLQGSLVALVAALVWQGVVFVHFVSRGGYVWDDLTNFRIAQTSKLSWGYLTAGEFEQWSPGHKLLDWLLQRFVPMRFGAAVGVSAVLFVAGAVVLYLVIARLSRPGWTAVALTAFAAASVINVGTAQWWAAGAFRLPATLLSLLCILAWFGDRGRALAVLALAIAVLFSFAALFVPLYLVLFDLLISRHEWRTRWRAWIPLAAIGAVAVIAFAAYQPTPIVLSSPLATVRYMRDAWINTFVPGLVGITNPGPVAAAALEAVLAGVVTLTVVRRRAACRPWVLFGVAAVANLLFIGLTRTHEASPTLIARSYRYLPDLTALFVICLALALTAPGGARHVAAPARRTPLVVGVAILLAVDLVTTWRGDGIISSARAWYGPAAATYEGNLRRTLAAATRHGAITVVDGIVPPYVAPPQFGTYSRYSAILPLFTKHLVFGPVTGAVWGVASNGDVVPVTFTTALAATAAQMVLANELFVARSVATTDEAGWLCVQSGALPAVLTVALPSPLPAADWHLVLLYRADRAGNMFVFADHGPSWVAAHDSYIPLSAGSHAQTIDVGEPGLSDVLLELPVRSKVCVDGLALGQLTAR